MINISQTGATMSNTPASTPSPFDPQAMPATAQQVFDYWVDGAAPPAKAPWSAHLDSEEPDRVLCGADQRRVDDRAPFPGSDACKGNELKFRGAL
jgi:hypothetical protein